MIDHDAAERLRTMLSDIQQKAMSPPRGARVGGCEDPHINGACFGYMASDSAMMPPCSRPSNTDLLIRRMLDDLYWVMSYSRWKDDRFWPLFRDAILRTHPDVTAESLEAAREYNFKCYHFQVIGRYTDM